MRIRCARFLPLLPLLIAAQTAHAADDTQQFVDALRQRGYFDLALDYLDTIPTSGVASDEFKQSLPYQRGSVLAAKSRIEPNPANRARLVAQARSELETFAEANRDKAEGASAYLELAQLVRRKSADVVARSREMPVGGAEREQLWAEAREGYDAAREYLNQAEKSYMDLLAKYPKAIPATEKELRQERFELRAYLANARLNRAACLLDKSQAYAKGSQDYVKLSEQAAADFLAIYDKYSGFPVGVRARLFQGRSLLNLDKLREAIGCFEDVVVRASTPSLRSSVTLAHSYQAEAYIADEKYDQVLTKNAAWLTKARGSEGQEPLWLRLKYQVAEAARLKAELPDTPAADKRKLLLQSQSLYREVARRPNEFQRDARLVVAEMAGDVAAAAPQTFAAAYQAGKDAINSMNAAQFVAKAAQENNPDAVPELEAQVQRGFDEAVSNFELALRLVDDDTPIKELNDTRYRLSYLLWQDGRYHQSAVLAEFIARRYANDPIAESAAKIALAALEQLYNQARESGDADFEARRLEQMAGFVTKRWPTSQTAELSFGIILNFALRENRFAEAQAQIAQLEDDRRPLFEARLANAMWEAQARARDGGEVVSFDPDTVRSEAKRLFRSSLPALASDPTAEATLAAASLYLSLAYLGDGEFQQAIELLEDEEMGGLALTTASNPVSAKSSYRLNVYKTALRAYVAVTPPQTDKAVAMMAELEQAAEAAGGGQMLANTYVGIGFQLKQQIDQLVQQGKAEEAQHVTKAFAAFLAKIRDSSDQLEFPVRQWIAQTYFNLGEATTDEQSRSEYFTSARDEFKALLDLVEANAELASGPNTQLALQLQLGNSLRELGEYDAAIKLFESILTENEMMLDVQKAAAYALQEWGESLPDDVARLEMAIGGGETRNGRGSKVVWGWYKLSRTAAAAARRDERWRELFFECWVNIATCRYLQGLNASDDEQRAYFKRAKDVVRSFHGNYPELVAPPIHSFAVNSMR